VVFADAFPGVGWRGSFREALLEMAGLLRFEVGFEGSFEVSWRCPLGEVKQMIAAELVERLVVIRDAP
jgi:hypothetical protein